MAGMKTHGVICSSLLIGAATGLTAWSEDSVVLRRDLPGAGLSEIGIPPEPVGDPLAAPFEGAGEPLPAPFDSVTRTPYPQYECPPNQPPRQGFFSRFKQRCRAKYWGYPEEFYEPPLGSMVNGYQMTQIANGQAARMAMYQYDFLPDSDQLSVRGKAQICRIALWLPANHCPVFVESTPGNLELDELRRQTVWSELERACFPIPPERVIVGRPNIRGLHAAESLLIDRSRLSLTAGRGISAGGGGGTSGTSTISSGSSGTLAR